MGDATYTKGNSNDLPSKSEDERSTDASSVEKNKDEEKKEPEPTVSYHQLYRFADTFDIILIIIGVLAGAAHGTGLPLLFVFFGDLTTAMTDFGRYTQCDFNMTQCIEEGYYNGTEDNWKTNIAPLEQLTNVTQPFVLAFVYVACGVLVCATLQVSTFCFQAVRQSKRIRVQYFRGILRQDTGFHDSVSSGELNTRLAE